MRRFVDMFAARTILTVPLVVEDQAIGVCHAINNAAGRSQTATWNCST